MDDFYDFNDLKTKIVEASKKQGTLCFVSYAEENTLLEKLEEFVLDAKEYCDTRFYAPVDAQKKQDLLKELAALFSSEESNLPSSLPLAFKFDFKTESDGCILSVADSNKIYPSVEVDVDYGTDFFLQLMEFYIKDIHYTIDY